jgi:hypothetical protein
MNKSQLFRKTPSDEIINKILGAFMISDIDDQKTFSKIDMKHIRTIEKLQQLRSEMEEFYIPCKARTYLVYIDERTALTILRQFIRIKERVLISYEKFMNGKKFSVYSISRIFSKKYQPINDDNKDASGNTGNQKFTLYFD